MTNEYNERCLASSWLLGVSERDCVIRLIKLCHIVFYLKLDFDMKPHASFWKIKIHFLKDIVQLYSNEWRSFLKSWFILP